MTPADAISLSSNVALIVLGLAMLLASVRIIIGPTLADRVLSLDLLTVLAMAFIGALAIRTGQILYLDIAIALALLSFLATIAFARYVMSRRLAQETKQ